MAETTTVRRADGYTMTTMAAADLCPGDLLPLAGTWNTVVRVTIDDPTGPAPMAQITIATPDGERVLPSLAEREHAILRLIVHAMIRSSGRARSVCGATPSPAVADRGLVTCPDCRAITTGSTA